MKKKTINHADLLDPKRHLDSTDLSSLMHSRDKEEDHAITTTISKNPHAKPLPWSLDMKELTLNANTLANWGLQEAEVLVRYLEHPVNSLQSVNLWCFAGWNPQASEVKIEVFELILQSLGCMPRLQSLSVDCKGIPLSMLPRSLLRLPSLEIRGVDVFVEDALDFAQALSHQEYDQKLLSFIGLNDWSVDNLFAAFEEYPMDSLERLEAKNLRSAGLKSMSNYLRDYSPEELILRSGTWTADRLGQLIDSLIAPSNAVTNLKFQRASFPPSSKTPWKQLFQQKNNLQTLSFIDLAGNHESHFNEGLIRALMECPKLPESLTSLDLVHTLQPTRPPHSSFASVIPILLAQNPQLRSLNIPTSLAGLQDNEMVPISKALSTSSLERLNLSSAYLSQAGLQSAVRLLPPTLKHLNLSRMELADQTMDVLGQWLSQPGLCVEELILDWCDLTPTGLDSVFAALTKNKALRQLSLQWCEPLGLKGWLLLAHYLPKLPETLVDLSFGSYPLKLRESREDVNTRSDRRERRKKEKLQSKVVRNQVMELLRQQTNLLNIQLQLDLPIGSSANYFARRNQCFQFCLLEDHHDPSVEDLLRQIRMPQAMIPKVRSSAVISTSLVERALQKSMRASADAGTKETDDCELSLLYDCFSQRPELIISC